MGASKTSQYSCNEIKTANIARALAHPARLRILNLVSQKNCVRNTDLVYELQLVKSTINSHLAKLKDADLIQLEFHSNSYLIRSNEGEIDKIPQYFDILN